VTCARRCIPAVCILCSVVACGVLPRSALAQKVNIDYDHNADFSHIRRYQWRTHSIFEKHPQLQETYATGIQIVLDAGNTQLMKRGFQPDDSSADIFITFFLLSREDQRLKSTMDAGWGSEYTWTGLPYSTTTQVEQYLRGMLVIDIVDAHTSKLLWRAYCGDEVKDFRKRDKNITSAVRRAFDRFPPK
jgi:hypothetical protein